MEDKAIRDSINLKTTSIHISYIGYRKQMALQAFTKTCPYSKESVLHKELILQFEKKCIKKTKTLRFTRKTNDKFITYSEPKGVYDII